MQALTTSCQLQELWAITVLLLLLLRRRMLDLASGRLVRGSEVVDGGMWTISLVDNLETPAARVVQYLHSI